MSETKRERYIRILSGLGGADISSEACKELVELLKEQPETAAQTAESAQNVSNEDLISRKAAIDAIYHHLPSVSRTRARTMLHEVPSAQPEPLTDKEQRIFLSAMEREEGVCKQVDDKCCREPYEVSLVEICHGNHKKGKRCVMDDLISRQAVQKMVDRIGGMYLYRQIGNGESYSQYNEAWTDAISRVDAELNSLPPAQPERKRGEWVDYTEDGYLECPFCGSATNCEDNREELHYCFSCGAELR